MPKITIEIENCDDCQQCTKARVYTPDSWDDVRELKCKVSGKIVYKYLDWYDKSPVPKDCPLRVE